MRIVHLSIARELTSGQIRQLRFEYDVAQKISDITWTTLAYHNGPTTEPYIRHIPFLFQSLFLRKLWGWLVALRLSRTHDIVMMRHTTFDPFSFIFAPLIKNRVSIHHAKEVEELLLIRKGWKGQAASYLEYLSGGFAVRRAKMILGVTQEIADYERDSYAPGKPTGVYPNGINVYHVPALGDKRLPNQVHAAFMCGVFSAWHGLDKLITAVDTYVPKNGDRPLLIHLIGKLSDEQMSDIAATESRRKIFKAYGSLDEAKYRLILDQCDFGITSLALERKGLREASTLKVREMLACGLAIYSGHEDIALDVRRDWVKIDNHPTIHKMINFGIAAKDISRELVREESLPYIQKEKLMQDCVKIFGSLGIYRVDRP